MISKCDGMHVHILYINKLTISKITNYSSEKMKHLAFVVFLIFSTLSLLAQKRDYPIIDMHMHAQEEIRSSISPSFPDPNNGIKVKINDISELLPETVKAMKDNGVVLGILTWENLEELYKWKAYEPDMFLLGKQFWDPSQTDISVLRKEYEEKKLSILGEIGTQLNGFAPNDPGLEPFYSLAEEFNVPVLIHCAGLTPGNVYIIEHGNPLLLDDVLKKHPKLRLYIENASYPFIEEIIALMYRYPNVYADLSTMSWIIPRKSFHNYLEELMDAGLGKRLMYGTDQMIWPESIGLSIEAIESAKFLSEDEKRDIFYNNAARFLRLTEDEIDEHHKKIAHH